MSSIDENFVVKTGLTVGPTTIVAATGAITTTGNITAGTTVINGTTGNITVGGTTINGGTGAISTTSTITVGNTVMSSSGPLTTANLQATGGAITSTPISGSTGSFTTLSVPSINATPIGNATPSTGTFTTLNATSMGGYTMTGNLILNADPVNPLGAATKQYVDTIAAGLNLHGAAEIATTAASNLPANIYVAGTTGADGGTGVGAYLEGSVNGAFGTVGGYAGMLVGERVLVKDQAVLLQNGIYVATSLGSAGTKWRLTRASDGDNHLNATDVAAGDFFYIAAGTLAGTQWSLSTEGAIVVGTSSLVYTQISGTNLYVGGTGINVASNTITNTGVLSLATSGTGVTVNQSTGAITISSNATATNTVSTIVARDASGSFAANVVTATSTAARYADLAEKYSADAMYMPGTVVEFGGEAEVTIAAEGSRKVAGVVSTNPAYLMNVDAVGVAVALTGRVPCRVTGKVAKGDMLVSAGNGKARAEADPKLGQVIGKALENFDSAEGVIEVVVGRM